MFRYAITSRALYPGDETQKQAVLVEQCARWAVEGMDFIQLREKDLPAQPLAALAHAILAAIPASSPTKLLINTRADVALATGAHGVHLTAEPGELTPVQVRQLYAATHTPVPIVTISCHTVEEVRQSRNHSPDTILFAPVFGKFITGEQPLPGLGLDRLREACIAAAPIPVYALGGVTSENAPSCISAGAAGVAAIRLFLR